MRRFLVIAIAATILSGYFFARYEQDAVKAFNHSNLFPYEATTGYQLKPQV
ncbi:MAG: hypothetical protein GX952_02280 [Firmicutes bacterium]|nr:hypothetical protein [Bacillota bacterium]